MVPSPLSRLTASTLAAPTQLLSGRAGRPNASIAMPPTVNVYLHSGHPGVENLHFWGLRAEWFWRCASIAMPPTVNVYLFVIMFKIILSQGIITPLFAPAALEHIPPCF